MSNLTSEMRQLLQIVHGMVKAQDHVPQDFDAEVWLFRWVERPQPSLGGKTPKEVLGTYGGLEVVRRLLGAAASGAYQ